mgnify:FL=1
MYKKNKNHQIAFTDFNQPIGMKMNPDNRWVKKAAMIPWNEIEEKYATLFPSNTGNVAKPLRMALGSLLIQQQLHFPDEELVEEIRENPYFQYFIGLPGYVDAIPFVPSLLVEFRKRLSADIMIEINEMIIAYNMPGDDSGDNNGNSSNSGTGENAAIVEGYDTTKNSGTLIIDATCAPQNIKYPQDINLLNEAREKLEKLIKKICKEQNWYVPRMYRKRARKDYLNLAKCRKRPAKKVRAAIKKQLNYVSRDLGYIDWFLGQGCVELSEREAAMLDVIQKVYEQQLYMYENKTHSVEDRIVSISQPYIRPIVRGKAKAPTEFGAKLDLSVDEHGMARLEKLSFDAYNESDVLKAALDNYRERTGHYPERMLADQIYRNRDNINFCKKWHIRLSGKALGRPKKALAVDKKTEYQDNVDRIEVERKFSLAKRKFGLGLIRTKLEDTTKSSILLAIIAMNVDRLSSLFIRWIFWVLLRKHFAAGC